jgi:spermidine synthase
MPTELLSEVEAAPLPTQPRPRRQFGFTFLLLISGFCGISYEVLYGRILSNFIGDQFAISASILLTFMLGIGVGSLYAHRLWRWLWAIEGGIGLYAATMALGAGAIESWFYSSRFLSQGLGGAMFVCFLLLIVPAFMVGCSLPLFAGYLGQIGAGRVFARAYMIYNFGAALTVLVIEFVLLRALGLRATVLIMAALNVLVSLLLLWRFRAVRERPPARVEFLSVPRRYVAALALASVGSAVFQLLMVKMAECFLGPFRQTFALVLTVVLCGLAIGSALARKWKLSFAAVLITALAGLLWMAVGFEVTMTVYSSTYASAVATAWTTVLHKVAALFLLMGVPAVAFGALIPALLSELSKSDEDSVARDSGKLLCISSLANAAGFLVMAFVLHRFFDYGTVVLVVAVIVGLSVVVWAGFRAGITRVAAAVIAVLAAFQQFKWDENLLYIGYDRFQSRDVLEDSRAYLQFPERFKGFQDVFSLNHVGDDVHFFINGYISIAMNSPAEKIVGAFPAMFAPRNDRALVLGVGSGATCGTVAALFDRVDGVEINPVVLQNLDRMAEYNFDLASRQNVNFILDDGVHFTKVSRDRYTLIINTVTAPIYFSSSKLYTADFLRVVRRCLTADGIYVTWVDSRVGDHGLDIIFKTIREAGFKECALAGIKAGYFILLCSDEPIKLRDPALIAKQPQLADYFKKEGVFPEWIPYSLLTTRALDLIVNTNVAVNTLDRPALEFQMARMDDRYSGKWATNLRRQLSLQDVTNALAATMSVNLVDLAIYTERLYEDSSLTRRRFELIEQQTEDFDERFRPAKLEYFGKVADLAGTPRARHAYARELMKQQKFAEAIEQEQKVLALDPEFNNAWYTIAMCQEQSGQFDAALASYKKELKVDPQDARINRSLGRVHYKRKDYTQALAYLERAIERRDHFENHIYLSLTLEALGRKIEADDHFQYALNFGMKGAEAPSADFAGAAPQQ